MTPFSETEAEGSCFINWQNQMIIFGGHNIKRQISQLDGHKLKRIGTLAFDHYRAACTVMNNEFIFLCFNGATSRKGLQIVSFEVYKHTGGPLNDNFFVGN